MVWVAHCYEAQTMHAKSIKTGHEHQDGAQLETNVAQRG